MCLLFALLETLHECGVGTHARHHALEDQIQCARQITSGQNSPYLNYHTYRWKKSLTAILHYGHVSSLAIYILIVFVRETNINFPNHH